MPLSPSPPSPSSPSLTLALESPSSHSSSTLSLSSKMALFAGLSLGRADLRFAVRYSFVTTESRHDRYTYTDKSRAGVD
jgi:hypothetical protein